MKRKEIIKLIVHALNGKEAVVSSTGLMSRELFNMRDAPQSLYMTGSMGLASSLGLGIATSNPNREVVIIEGDASLLMNLGSIGTIGHYTPKNLIHIVLDNNAYGSCDRERSISHTFRLDKIAKLAGYKKVENIKEKERLRSFLEQVLKEKGGPVFILVKMELGGRRDLPRPLELDRVAKRFKVFLSKSE